MGVRIHVIDQDSRRRASIARDFIGRGLHAEIYEDLAEFGERMPAEGYVFALDDPDTCDSEQLTELMQSRGVPLPVTFYTPEPVPQRIVKAMHLGAWNYLQWPFDSRLLDSSLRMLAAVGDRLIDEHRRRSEARAAVERLSAREAEVLKLMVGGRSNKDIGLVLAISPRTVEIHRANMMRKLEAQTASDAVRTALYAGVDADFGNHGVLNPGNATFGLAA